MMKHRKLLYGFIIAFCVVSVAYGMYYIVIGRNKTNNKKSANVTTVNVAQANNSVTEPTGKIDATEELKKDFNKMFKNKIILNGYNSEQINKRVADKEIIFTVDAKELKRDDKYEISTH